MTFELRLMNCCLPKLCVYMTGCSETSLSDIRSLLVVAVVDVGCGLLVAGCLLGAVVVHVCCFLLLAVAGESGLLLLSLLLAVGCCCSWWWLVVGLLLVVCVVLLLLKNDLPPSR